MLTFYQRGRLLHTFPVLLSSICTESNGVWLLLFLSGYMDKRKSSPGDNTNKALNQILYEFKPALSLKTGACGHHGRSSLDKREETEQGREGASVITSVKHPIWCRRCLDIFFFSQADWSEDERRKRGKNVAHTVFRGICCCDVWSQSFFWKQECIQHLVMPF